MKLLDITVLKGAIKRPPWKIPFWRLLAIKDSLPGVYYNLQEILAREVVESYLLSMSFCLRKVASKEDLTLHFLSSTCTLRSLYRVVANVYSIIICSSCMNIKYTFEDVST